MFKLISKIKKSFYEHFSPEVPIDDRICYLMCIFGITANLLGVIGTIAINLPLICLLVCASSLFVMISLSVVAFVTRKTRAISIIMTVLVTNVAFPGMFLLEGGMQGGMQFFFLVSPICIAFTIKSFHKYILIIFSIIEYSVLIGICFLYPQFVIPLPENAPLINCILCLICVFAFVYIFAYEYTKQSNRDHIKINKLSLMYKHQANTDEVTDLFNRRYFKEQFCKLIEENNKKAESNLYLVMFDLDGFKKINDVCGHVEGDRILKRFADIMFDECTVDCIASRYGGDEFTLLINNSNFYSAYNIAQSILLKTREKILLGNGLNCLTVSGGFICCRKDEDYSFLMQKVDEKLYEAKETGKNRLML